MVLSEFPHIYQAAVLNTARALFVHHHAHASVCEQLQFHRYSWLSVVMVVGFIGGI